MRESLLDRASDFGISLEDVAITHLSFGTEFTKAVEMKQVAEQDAERARFVVMKAEQVRSIEVLCMLVHCCSTMILKPWQHWEIQSNVHLLTSSWAYIVFEHSATRMCNRLAVSAVLTEVFGAPASLMAFNQPRLATRAKEHVVVLLSRRSVMQPSSVLRVRVSQHGSSQKPPRLLGRASLSCVALRLPRTSQRPWHAMAMCSTCRAATTCC